MTLRPSPLSEHLLETETGDAVKPVISGDLSNLQSVGSHRTFSAFIGDVVSPRKRPGTMQSNVPHGVFPPECHTDFVSLPNPEVTAVVPDAKVGPWKIPALVTVAGPGLIVCLADTDGPCLITAGTSGARYGYSLLLSQIVLIPILYAAQELTVRLALHTGRGLTDLIKREFGFFMGFIACVLLVITCVAAIISEVSCLAQVGLLWGIQPAVSAWTTFVFLLAVVLTGTYRQVELIGLGLGCCQMVTF